MIKKKKIYLKKRSYLIEENKLKNKKNVEILKMSLKDFINENTEHIPGYICLGDKCREVLIYKMAGYQNKDIANILHIKEKTVKFHFTAICRILNELYFIDNKINQINKSVVYLNMFYQCIINKLQKKEIKEEPKEESKEEKLEKVEEENINKLPEGVKYLDLQ